MTDVLKRILAGALCWLALVAAGAVVAAGAAVAASAESFDQAVPRFAADSFSETEAAITEVATSGHPRAATVIQALQEGRLLFDGASKKVYIKDQAGNAVDAITAAVADPNANLKPVRLNNRLRRAIDA